MKTSIKKLPGWVRKTPSNMNEDINNLTDDELFKIIDNDRTKIREIKNPSKELQFKIAVIDTSSWLLINNIHDEVLLFICEMDGLEIRWIPDQTLELQLASVNQNGYALKYIDEPFNNVIEVARNNPIWSEESIKYCSSKTKEEILNMFIEEEENSDETLIIHSETE